MMADGCVFSLGVLFMPVLKVHPMELVKRLERSAQPCSPPGICKDDQDLIRPGRITMKPTIEQNALVKACDLAAKLAQQISWHIPCFQHGCQVILDLLQLSHVHSMFFQFWWFFRLGK